MATRSNTHNVLTFLILLVTSSSAKFSHSYENQEILITKDHLDLNVGAPPIPGTNGTHGLQTPGCPCNQILVSSLGPAQHIQAAVMGVYKYYTAYNGHPAYQNSGGPRLYFLQGSGWLLGPSLGAPHGYIHNSNAFLCPYLIPSGWMYVNGGYWYEDQSLVVRCIV